MSHQAVYLLNHLQSALYICLALQLHTPAMLSPTAHSQDGRLEQLSELPFYTCTVSRGFAFARRHLEDAFIQSIHSVKPVHVVLQGSIKRQLEVITCIGKAAAWLPHHVQQHAWGAD